MQKAREAISRLPDPRKARKIPRLFVLRLATKTGVSAGWWIMSITAALIGAVAAVAAVTVVHVLLKRQSPLDVESTALPADSET